MQHVDDHKRWLDLLEDLGLPPEETPPPAPVVKAAPVVAAPPPTPAPVPVPEPIREPEPVAEEATAEPMAEEAPAVRGRRRRPTPSSEPAGDPSAGESAEEPKEAASRVRRRRRVGKPAAASEADIVEDNGTGEDLTPPSAPLIDPVETPSALPTMAVEPSLESPLEEPPSAEEEDSADVTGAALEGEGSTGEVRRRRRRRRRKSSEAGEGAAKSPVVAAQASSKDLLEEEPDFVDPSPSLADDLVSEDEEIGEEELTSEFAAETPSALDEDADEFEDLTELNMPSWTELVASLYRPPDR